MIAVMRHGAVLGTSVLRTAFVFLLLSLVEIGFRAATELHAQSPSANTIIRAALTNPFHAELAEEPQSSPRTADSLEARNRIIIEANPVRGTISYTRSIGGHWSVGPSVGFGFPKFDRTLTGGKDTDFREYLHLGFVARREFSQERVLLEFGGRAGFADYHSCTVSDCWPSVYGGPSVLLAVGSKRWKVGSRLTAGVIKGGGYDTEAFASISPLNVLVNWRW